MNKFSCRIGLIASFGMMLFFAFNAIGEYRDCSPDWRGMCGLGMAFLSITYGLVIPVFVLEIFYLILEKINQYFGIFLTPDMDHIITSSIIILIVGVTYFVIGYFLGWVYRKMTNK